jgi:hypothetical protein
MATTRQPTKRAEAKGQLLSLRVADYTPFLDILGDVRLLALA